MRYDMQERTREWMVRRTVIRYLVDSVGVISLLMGLSPVGGSGWFLSLGLLFLFLGVTDFGRQCPLILSARHLAYRIQSKGNPPIPSVKPIKEVSEGNRENKLP
jgi:hypothetical protein